MAWVFLINSAEYLQESIRFLTNQRPTLQALGYGGVVGGTIFSVVVAIVCATAWWTVWRQARRARIWGIAASLTFIAIFIRPFVIPLGSGSVPAGLSSLWILGPVVDFWIGRHTGDLWIAAFGLVVFLRPSSRADAESAS